MAYLISAKGAVSC